MTLPVHDVLGRRLPSTEALSVAFVGTVHTQNRRHLLKWLKQETTRQRARWVVVAIGEIDDLRSIQNAFEDRLQIVQDMKGDLHAWWNALILPRVYLDKERRLRVIRQPGRGCGGD